MFDALSSYSCSCSCPGENKKGAGAEMTRNELIISKQSLRYWWLRGGNWVYYCLPHVEIRSENTRWATIISHTHTWTCLKRRDEGKCRGAVLFYFISFVQFSWINLIEQSHKTHPDTLILVAYYRCDLAPVFDVYHLTFLLCRTTLSLN